LKDLTITCGLTITRGLTYLALSLIKARTFWRVLIFQLRLQMNY